MSQSKFSQFALGTITAGGFVGSAASAIANSASLADIAAPLRTTDASKTAAGAGDMELTCPGSFDLRRLQNDKTHHL